MVRCVCPVQKYADKGGQGNGTKFQCLPSPSQRYIIGLEVTLDCPSETINRQDREAIAKLVLKLMLCTDWEAVAKLVLKLVLYTELSTLPLP